MNIFITRGLYCIHQYDDKHNEWWWTNGDNEYDGSFFDKTVTNASANEVVVGVDFENRGHRITAAFDHVSNIELGSAVANLQVIRESGVRFLTSVPQHNSDPDGLLRARAMHDLDFWWFHKLLNISDDPHKIIHEVLFYHHWKKCSATYLDWAVSAGLQPLLGIIMVSFVEKLGL